MSATDPGFSPRPQENKGTQDPGFAPGGKSDGSQIFLGGVMNFITADISGYVKKALASKPEQKKEAPSLQQNTTGAPGIGTLLETVQRLATGLETMSHNKLFMFWARRVLKQTAKKYQKAEEKRGPTGYQKFSSEDAPVGYKGFSGSLD